MGFGLWQRVKIMKEYRQQAKILRAMARPLRLQILAALARGPACVCELIAITGRRQAYISQHLILLRQTGLVKRTRMGLNMRYELATESARNLLESILQDSQTSHSNGRDVKAMSGTCE